MSAPRIANDGKTLYLQVVRQLAEIIGPVQQAAIQIWIRTASTGAVGDDNSQLPPCRFCIAA